MPKPRIGSALGLLIALLLGLVTWYAVGDKPALSAPKDDAWCSFCDQLDAQGHRCACDPAESLLRSVMCRIDQRQSTYSCRGVELGAATGKSAQASMAECVKATSTITPVLARQIDKGPSAEARDTYRRQCLGEAAVQPPPSPAEQGMAGASAVPSGPSKAQAEPAPAAKGPSSQTPTERANKPGSDIRVASPEITNAKEAKVNYRNVEYRQGSAAALPPGSSLKVASPTVVDSEKTEIHYDGDVTVKP